MEGKIEGVILDGSVLVWSSEGKGSLVVWFIYYCVYILPYPRCGYVKVIMAHIRGTNWSTPSESQTKYCIWTSYSINARGSVSIA